MLTDRHTLTDLDAFSVCIAVDHHISTCQLYKVLAANGVQVTEWIGTWPRRSGFTDAPRFAGVFRTRYSVSTHEWRDMNRVEGDR